MTALLELAGVCKSFGERTLLDLDSVRIDTGCAYALTGINGSGKSTLMRILCGLEPASVASSHWKGAPIRWSPYSGLLRQSVVYVHQHPVLFSMQVAANVGYGLRARGVAQPQLQARVHEALQWAGISHLPGAAVRNLSGGEVQRVALARAKVLEPDLLLLDEPTSNLDGAAREQVLALIASLVGSGRSVVMACHDRDLINLPGVQRWKLRDGKLETKP